MQDDRGGVVADVPFWGPRVNVATVPHWNCAKLKLGVRQKASLDRTLKVLLICANISYLKLPTVELLTGIFVCRTRNRSQNTIAFLMGVFGWVFLYGTSLLMD